MEAGIDREERHLVAMGAMQSHHAQMEAAIARGDAAQGAPAVPGHRNAAGDHHVEGTAFPTINGVPLGGQAQQLGDHDLIEIAGVKMEFFYKP